jgi:predicted aspartyl protease
MKTEQAIAEVELKHSGKSVKVKCLVDTGASKSVISRKLSEELQSFIPLSEPYELKTADRGGRLRISGQCLVEVIFQGVKVPGRVLFEVADNLREDLDLIIGRPEIDSWDIIFTSEGPKPRKVPIEFEII